MSLRPLRHRLLFRLIIAALAVVALGAPAPTPATAAPPPTGPHSEAARLAGEWLAGQLVDGGMPGFVGTDWGLTLDALLALAATGADPTAAEEIGDALERNVDAYAAPVPGFQVGGATAKLLYAATVLDRDPRDFGGHDLRQRTLDLVAGPDSPWPGWIRNQLPDGTTSGSNMFDQSLTVLGLTRSGGVPQPAVDFLISQQCPAGGWRLFPDADGTPCAQLPPADQAMDPDTTAYATQALLAAGDAAGASEAAAAGLAWLQSVQRSSGAFHGSAVTDYPNTNSTGLAGQALAAGGDLAGADRAAAWVAARQVTTTNAGAAGDHIGAIAYTPETLAAAFADGIPDPALDQWRRTTTQAVLALAQVPLGEITVADRAPAPVSPGPSTPASTGPTGSPDPAPGQGGGLPATGSPVVTMATAGGAVLLFGVGLVAVARRGARRRGVAR